MRRRIRVLMLRRDSHSVTYAACVRRSRALRMVGQVEVVNTTRGYYYVRRMFVYPEWRRRGIATRLMRKVVRDARPHRLELICSPEPGSLAAHSLARFYRGFGFDYAPSAWADRDARDSDQRRMARPGKKIKAGER